MGNNSISLPLDQEYIQGLLQSVLGDSSLQIGEWEVQALQGGLEFASAIYRLQGKAGSGDSEQLWSLILKTIQPETQFDDPQGYRYWKREVQAYQSGLLQELPGQISAPRCYAIQEQPDGSLWIWLEDIRDPLEHPWPISIYSQVANRLGQFNGAYLAGHLLPNATWITHDWLRKYLDHASPMVEFIRQNPAHPVVQLMFPGISLPMTLGVWEERTRMLKVLDELPQTFCHQDAFKRNLFNRSEQVIAIDWGYAGIAPVGAELAPLIGVAFGLANFPSSQAKDLDQACFAGYLEGLRQAGWNADPRQVRMGYTLTVLLRYVLGATIGEMLPGLLDEKTRTHWAEGVGSPPEKVGESDAGIIAYYQSTAFEALKLLGLGTFLRVAARTAIIMLRLSRTRRNSR